MRRSGRIRGHGAALAAAVFSAALAGPGDAAARGSPAVAALQVALRGAGVYAGPVNGLDGPATAAAVRRFQSRHALVRDGIVGAQTLGALGPFARHRLGDRVLRRRDRGWDVAELEFALAWQGFPSGPFDGRFGPHVLGAVLRFQRSAGLPADGLVGPRTLAALRQPPPRAPFVLSWPVAGTLGDGFGPRGDGFHAGIDVEAPVGAPVEAAAGGRVAWVGDRDGWGLLVTIAHGRGVRTLYAPLSAATVRLGERVPAGALVGRVGATGDATGPHLHFEVRVRGAAVDPLTALPSRWRP
jgi:murein DD-endopeptidase MepM/ murein hydrolase activator NlpD